MKPSTLNPGKCRMRLMVPSCVAISRSRKRRSEPRAPAVAKTLRPLARSPRSRPTTDLRRTERDRRE